MSHCTVGPSFGSESSSAFIENPVVNISGNTIKSVVFARGAIISEKRDLFLTGLSQCKED